MAYMASAISLVADREISHCVQKKPFCIIVVAAHEWAQKVMQQIFSRSIRREICIRCWINECRNAFRSVIAAMTSAWKRFPTVSSWEASMQNQATFGFSWTVLRSARPVRTSCCACQTSTVKHAAFVHRYVKAAQPIANDSEMTI